MRRENFPGRSFIRRTIGLLLISAAAAAQEPIQVETGTAEQRPWTQTLRLTGTLTSASDSALAPRLDGLVTEIRVDAGDRVERGDVLLELDDQLERLSLQSARASLQEARAQLAEARRVRAEREPLLEKGAIAQTEFETANADVQVRAAAVERLRAEVALRQERVARHQLTAPFPGLVSRRMTDVGEWVTNTTPVYELVQTDQLRLDVQAPQEYFPMIEQGTRVMIAPHALNDTQIEGEVRSRVAVADPTARSFLVRVAVDNESGRLAPGMSALALIKVVTEDQTLVIPRDALMRYPDGGTRVWTVEDRGDQTVAVERQVQIGRSDAGVVEITKGLEPDRRVIVVGNEALTPEQPVMIKDRQ
ncbi:MAG: efflux transporter periplasmic adaptor subunit [Salinisphaeraceae bacterium]|jgi:RND family efflux transporter MFP subunit|nr:efflux transporter periplasmic adaptor subunit [Salinisphaeraceae bacterium]